MAKTAVSITQKLQLQRYIVPVWPAPSNVLAVSTQRDITGDQQHPLAGFNVAKHVHDDHQTVVANRLQLQQDLQLPKSPVWLQQSHSTRVVALPLAELPLEGTVVAADGSYTQQVGQSCVVMTADCLPVLFCDKNGTQVAAAHAGWRGLAAGILENTIAKFETPNDLLVWLGPAIGPQAFEVGQDVFDAFQDPQSFELISTTTSYQPPKYLANIYQLARTRLNALGVNNVYGGSYCTFSNPRCFYSHRRNSQSGRQAALISLLS